MKNLLQIRKSRFDPRVRKIPWRSKRQLTPVFLPGKSPRQRRLAGYTPWDCKELDTTEWVMECASCSVVSDSLWPHPLYSHGILQARILEWVTFPFFRGFGDFRRIFYQLSHKGRLRILESVAYLFASRSSKNQPGVCWIADGFFTNWVVRKAECLNNNKSEITMFKGGWWGWKELNNFKRIYKGIYILSFVILWRWRVRQKHMPECQCLSLGWTPRWGSGQS